MFNITLRLGRESVGERDESLYATTAWETSQSGNLIGTTFDGALDYDNTKPPVNVWAIAVSYRLFGVNLWCLRSVVPPVPRFGMCIVTATSVQ